MRRRLSMALAALLAAAPGAATAAALAARVNSGTEGSLSDAETGTAGDSTAARAAARPKRDSSSAARRGQTVVERLTARGERIRKARAASSSVKRAQAGEQVAITITYYCLRGTTRTDNPVREGIVAADPRVFPLRRHVDVSVRGRFLGRFLVDDTGSKVKGNHLDIWTPSCAEARRKGRHGGTATLVARGDEKKVAKGDN